MSLRALAASAPSLVLVLACTRSTTPVAPPEAAESEAAEPEAAEPAPVAAPARESEACAAHRAALREQHCDPAAADEPCSADALACALECDLDGDGTPEHVALERVEGAITLGVTWADGRHALVASPAQPLVERESGDSYTDLSWLVSWSALRRDAGGGFVDAAGRRRTLPIGPAEGDVLVVSGGDAAAALLRRDGAFVLESLGY